MDLGIVLSAAQTLFAALQCKELQEMCSHLGYKSQVEDLEHTVSTVKAVLLDAETKQELNHEAQLYIEELKDAIYDADDLLDEFVTMVQQQKQLTNDGNASNKVRTFFSCYNRLGVAYNMSQGVKKIRKKLEAIANNHSHFGFSIDPQPIRRRREETCSYVYQGNVIGRENDVEKIVSHLLNDSRKEVSVLGIVGIGGLGKTALAQLIYNDARVKNAFPLRIWTCVSDHDNPELDIKQILRKILIGATGENHEVPTMELVQSLVRRKIAGEKYLLVLDDVWTEKRIEWLKLEEFLMGGQQGSWIVLTTRSHTTARIVGDGAITYELQGLSKENSLRLFKKVALGSGNSDPVDDLIKIGQEIVEDCARVPLAIKVVGSLLYGQDKSKWQSFRKIGLSNFRESQTDIMPILKLSYHQLESPLKSCFTYCALYPKGYELDVCDLKSLWMAQGYIVPLDDGQSIEDAAEEYISILLRRCFLHDVVYDEYGGIMLCKIHDLMHDIAQKVGGKEICLTKISINSVDKNARHLALLSRELAQLSFTESRLRSCFYVGPHLVDWEMDLPAKTLEALLSKWKCLRVLDLSYSGIKCLPDSIGEMLHLRYLDLWGNSKLEVLPQSIAKLYNLQTLILGGCKKLKELPRDFRKLVSLRTLVIEECEIKDLTCLVGLPHLKYLRLNLLEEVEYIIKSVEGFLCFPSLEMLHLNRLSMLRSLGHSMVTPLLLPRLKSIFIHYCPKMKCNLLLPKLEVLGLENVNESLQINRRSMALAPLSSCSYGVPTLKRVRIDNLTWLNTMPVESFRCLETLFVGCDTEIENLSEVREVFRCCSASLLSLTIVNCNKLRSVITGGLGHLSALQSLHISFCPSLCLSEEEENRKFHQFHRYSLFKALPSLENLPKWVQFSPTPLFHQSLRRLPLIALPSLENLPNWVQFSSAPPFHQSLRHLSLKALPSLRNLPNWMQFLSALETLEINWCGGLLGMPDWMPKLTSLRELRLHNCSEYIKKRCHKFKGEDWSLIRHIESIDIN